MNASANGRRMRFLMICMQFPTGEGRSYMTTELADALVREGHSVEVLFVDWNAAAGGPTEIARTRSGVKVVRAAPRRFDRVGKVLGNASKFVLTGRHIARTAINRFDLASFDAIIAWMPAVAIAPLLPLVRRAGIEHRLLFIWDFFPNHHHEIGRIGGGPPLWIARAWERRLLRHFTAIICTLPGNAAYLRRNYPVAADQQVLVTPIWSDTTPLAIPDPRIVRALHALPADRPIAVFGGQLVEGRGFDQMLGAADAALAEGSTLLFLFVGEGPLASLIEARARNQPNIAYLPSMSRRDYLQLLGGCDVGMVATVHGVSSYSIPTKTIDYLRSGLPVIAAVEHGSDFIEILNRYGVGAAVPFDDPLGFMREAARLASDERLREAVRRAAPRCLDEVFDVRHAVATVLTAASP